MSKIHILNLKRGSNCLSTCINSSSEIASEKHSLECLSETSAANPKHPQYILSHMITVCAKGMGCIWCASGVSREVMENVRLTLPTVLPYIPIGIIGGMWHTYIDPRPLAHTVTVGMRISWEIINILILSIHINKWTLAFNRNVNRLCEIIRNTLFLYFNHPTNNIPSCSIIQKMLTL